MKYQNDDSHNNNNNSNQMMKILSIFSILFASVFIVVILFSEDKGVVTAKAMSNVPASVSEQSLTTAPGAESEDTTTKSYQSSDEPKITKQSAIGSSISNYVNAWKLTKVTPVSQIIL